MFLCCDFPLSLFNPHILIDDSKKIRGIVSFQVKSFRTWVYNPSLLSGFSITFPLWTSTVPSFLMKSKRKVLGYMESDSPVDKAIKVPWSWVTDLPPSEKANSSRCLNGLRKALRSFSASHPSQANPAKGNRASPGGRELWHLSPDAQLRK